jgi:hypothetical protein
MQRVDIPKDLLANCLRTYIQVSEVKEFNIISARAILYIKSIQVPTDECYDLLEELTAYI